jgi:hypothetical protein
MATQYYFLISSLPLLRFGVMPFLSSSRFLTLVEEQAGRGVAESLAGITLLPREASRFSAEKYWYAMETHIRNYLLRSRSKKIAQIERWTRQETDSYPSLDQQLHKALGAPNPLERERLLDLIRWDLLDDALLGETFSVNALVVYRIRLLLTEKWQACAAEAGREVLSTLVEKARNEACQARSCVEGSH